MKIRQTNINSNNFWHVLDNKDQVISPIEKFLRYLFDLQRSPNTVKAYTYHLQHYWKYLYDKQLLWTEVKLDHLAQFISWLKQPDKKVIPIRRSIAKRTESSINTTLAAVTAFYKFHEQVSRIDKIGLYSSKISINPRYKPFLHHLNRSQTTRTQTLKIKVPIKLLPCLNKQSLKQILNLCNYNRDKFLISILYETGIRIGQALSLRHEDIKT